MRRSKLFQLMLILFLITILQNNLTAMGAGESKSVYQTELQQEFQIILNDIYNNKTSSGLAKKRLSELRTKHKISYTDEAGIMEAIIDRAEERSLTIDESRFYFKLLQEGTLMEYRREANRQQSAMHRREIAALLQNELEKASDEADSTEALLAVLNNYYDFLGLEYDQDYFRLSNLLMAIKKGEINADEIKTALAEMSKSETAANNEKHVQNNKQLSSGSGNTSTSQNNSASSGNSSSPSGNSSQPQTQQQSSGQKQSNSDAGSQKPSDSGSDSRR